LPIELKVLQTYKKEQGQDFRAACQQFALEQIEKQRSQLKKLGLLTDYEKFYVTFDPKYEAEQIRLFGKLIKDKLVYRGFRPIY
jgi:isoleucyl-tRNA synthetase